MGGEERGGLQEGQGLVDHCEGHAERRTDQGEGGGGWGGACYRAAKRVREREVS